MDISNVYRDVEIQELNWGMTSFDNVPMAFLTIFQAITLEGWTVIMEMYSDAYFPILTQIYFVVCIIVCSFFLLNLTIATMLENYVKQEEEARENSGQYDQLLLVGQQAGLSEEVIHEIIIVETTYLETISKEQFRR